MTRRLIGAGLLVGIASTMVIVPNAAAQDESRITLTVGLIQDLDSPNVTAGYLVSSFELWNLQYATLTDKAAEDFATIPGLAESWEASEDGLTYTYTLREGLLWSDGEPLTAEDIAWTINNGVGIAKFDRQILIQYLQSRNIHNRVITLTIAGQGGAPPWSFEGSDTTFVQG